MSLDPSRPGLSIPDGYSPEFARALYDYRMGNKWPNVISELKNRFGTSKYYIEAIETIYEHNEWKLEPKVKKDLRKIFNDEV